MRSDLLYARTVLFIKCREHTESRAEFLVNISAILDDTDHTVKAAVQSGCVPDTDKAAYTRISEHSKKIGAHKLFFQLPRVRINIKKYIAAVLCAAMLPAFWRGAAKTMKANLI